MPPPTPITALGWASPAGRSPARPRLRGAAALGDTLANIAPRGADRPIEVGGAPAGGALAVRPVAGRAENGRVPSPLADDGLADIGLADIGRADIGRADIGRAEVAALAECGRV